MITVYLSSVNIPILGLSADVESTKLIVPLFVISEESLANIPVLSCPLISIVPVFVKVAFSPDIPTDSFLLNVKVPVVSFKPIAVALVAVELLFLINIPVAFSPFNETIPLFKIFIFPCPTALEPNSSIIGLSTFTFFPSLSLSSSSTVLYAKPKIPIAFFPPTSIVPSLVTSEPFTE
ncbi:unknown [Fusobacterium sp. CAG:649]|nr:unknown [Fusobacterium sp. CAG:649]